MPSNPFAAKFVVGGVCIAIWVVIRMGWAAIFS